MGTFRARPEWIGDRQRNRGNYNAPPRPGEVRRTSEDPDATAWELEHPGTGVRNRPCGARRPTGRFCGAPVEHGEAVCRTCMNEITRVGLRQPGNRQWMMAQVGKEERLNARVRAEAAEKARAEQQAAERRAERERTAVHVVYYIRTAPDRVKIGYTGNLARRLREHRSDDTYLLALEPGDRALESQRHNELRKWRVTRNREDYAEGPEVTARIASVLAEHGEPLTWLAAAEAERDRQATEEKSA